MVMKSRGLLLLIGLAWPGAQQAWAQPSANYTYTVVGPVQSYPFYGATPTQIAINDVGEVAYQTPSGIYSSDGVSTVFIGVGQLGGISNSGEVAFIAGDVTAGSGQVIKSDGATSTTIATGLGLGWGAYVDINNGGMVAFTGILNGVQGVFEGNGGAITVLAKEGDLASSGKPLARLSQVSLADNGYAVFKAVEDDAIGLSGLFLRKDMAPPTKLIDDDFDPNKPGQNQYAGFDRPTISENGDVFTWAESYGNSDGVLVIPFGGSPAWLFYDPLGALGVLVGMTGNDCGRAVFEMGGLNFLAVSDGLLDSQGNPTVFERIVGEPDPLFSYAVDTVDLGPGNQRRMNRHGDFAFYATIHSGSVYYDAIIRADPLVPVVTIEATDPNASEIGLEPGEFTFQRNGDTSGFLTVEFDIAAGGNHATNGVDYVDSLTGLPIGTSVTIPAGQSSYTLAISPLADSDVEGTESVALTLRDDCAHRIGASATATVDIADLAPVDSDGDGVIDADDCAPADNGAFAIPVEASGVTLAADGVTVSWDSEASVAGSATLYEVIRGSIAGLPVGSQPSEVCAASGLTGTTWVDSTPPPLGEIYWYLVRARNVCGVGAYGTTSGGAPQLSGACP